MQEILHLRIRGLHDHSNVEPIVRDDLFLEILRPTCTCLHCKHFACTWAPCSQIFMVAKSRTIHNSAVASHSSLERNVGAREIRWISDGVACPGDPRRKVPTFFPIIPGAPLGRHRCVLGKVLRCLLLFGCLGIPDLHVDIIESLAFTHDILQDLTVDVLKIHFRPARDAGSLERAQCVINQVEPHFVANVLRDDDPSDC
mmetsp:Transcript_40008/g.100455  ORF Transcript_40008/g.100455 Transcript_40008/m.100455 type:complete len:200 (-) Transcript_40008:149-748(-)